MCYFKHIFMASLCYIIHICRVCMMSELFCYGIVVVYQLDISISHVSVFPKLVLVIFGIVCFAYSVSAICVIFF